MSEHVLKQLKFALGYECNRTCGFCLQQLSDKAPKLNLDWVKRVFAEEMVANDVERIVLTGGEPTYAPYLDTTLEIVKLASWWKKETCIFTNGDMLNDAMLERFKKAGLTRFRVSLYDPVEWLETNLIMKRLREHGFPAFAKYTVTKESFPYLITFLYKILPLCGVDRFQIKPYNRVEVPDIDSKYELEPEQVLELSKILLKYRKDFPEIQVDMLPLCYEFAIDETIPLEELSPCNCGQGPNGYLVVQPSGDIKICGAYPVALGNIEHDSLEDIWNNHPLLEEVRTKADKPRPDDCKECGHWEKCAKTDCHSATYAKYKNFNHANPQCPMAKANV
jgi:radical SAM protein with 4Fe4S-binding SPASM domain